MDYEDSEPAYGHTATGQQSEHGTSPVQSFLVFFALSAKRLLNLKCFFLYFTGVGQKGENEKTHQTGKKYTVTHTKHTAYKSGGHSGYGQYGEGESNRY